jgi:predicted GIY-YIG superfamily endonuclease
MTVFTGTDIDGWVYLIHFDDPYKHAKHYTGWTTDLCQRLVAHAQGKAGARLMEVVAEAGITWALARVERGTRRKERARKGRTASVWCPMCRKHTIAFPAAANVTAVADALRGTRGRVAP